MNNRLSLKSDAMLARLVKDGGSYEVVEHSSERCAIKITYQNRVYQGEITWEEAQLEPFVYSGKTSDVLEKLPDPEKRKKLQLSQNYATPRRRMQHLWARVVSDTVRVIAPNLVSGTYTPEEVADFSGLVTPELVAASQTAGGQLDATNQAEQVIASLSESPVEKTTVQSVASTVATSVEDPSSTPEQVAEINQLIAKLRIPADKIALAFAKRGAKDALGLTSAQAAEMIDSLRSKLTSQPTQEGMTTMEVHGPVTQETEARIRSKIKEVAQESGDGKKFADKIKLKLTASGMKLSDMSQAGAEELLRSLESMQIEKFFEMPLIPYASNEGDVGNASSETPS